MTPTTPMSDAEALAVLAQAANECEAVGIADADAELERHWSQEINSARAHLAARVAELEHQLRLVKDAENHYQEQLVFTEAELVALKPNAERYVWLRDANNADPAPFIAQRYEYGIMQWTGEKADAAIDAARGAG